MQREEAGRLYRRAIALSPNTPTYRGNYAIYLEMNGSHAAAGTEYERAAAERSCDANTLCGFSIWLRNNRQAQRAQTILQRAFDKEPTQNCVAEQARLYLKK